jgi:hypothetical protein
MHRQLLLTILGILLGDTPSFLNSEYALFRGVCTFVWWSIMSLSFVRFSSCLWTSAFIVMELYSIGFLGVVSLSSSTDLPQVAPPLIVRLSCQDPKKRTRKRIRRQVAKCNRLLLSVLFNMPSHFISSFLLLFLWSFLNGYIIASYPFPLLF